MPNKKILIVDDDKEFLEEFKETLSLSGYTVTEVCDSTLTVKIAQDIKPDVILLDLRMQTMSGFEVADQLKRFAETSRIPIIAMSGFYALKENEWIMNFCGIKKCLKKPFNPLDAIATIEEVLKKSEEVLP